MTAGSLQVRDLFAGYQGSTVLQGTSLHVEPGEVLTILGRNGVGKTTLVNTIAGLVRATKGSIRLQGVELAGQPPHRIGRAGVGLVPQGRRVFGPLTVEENLAVAQRWGRKGRWNADAIYDFMPKLSDRRAQRADQLSGGEQQQLAIARALLTNPSLLLLDEPSDGLAPMAVQQVRELVSDLVGEGLSVLLVEQNLALGLSVAHRVAVMVKGQIVLDVSPEDFRSDRQRAHELLGVG